MCYDIADPRRLRRVFQIMRGHGDHLQYSVFRCLLSKAERIRLVAKLSQVIHHAEDQVLIIDLGSEDRAHRRRFHAIGLPLKEPPRNARIF